MDIDLTEPSVAKLLKLLGQIPVELMRRGLIQSVRKNPTGDLAERYVARALGTEPFAGRDTGFDVIEPGTDSRIHFKGCRPLTKTIRAALHWSDIELLGADRFDELVGVVLDQDYAIVHAWRMPRATVQRLARAVRGKKRLYVTDVRRAQADGDASIQDMELPPLDDRGDGSRSAAS